MKQNDSKVLIFKRNQACYNSVRVLLVLFWVVAIILPLLTMMVHMTEIDIIKVVTANKFIKALKQSVIVSTFATIISVSLAGVLAWCTSRTNIRFKGAFAVLFTIPMLIPSISHGMGLVILFGTNGVLNNLLGLSFTIYGFGGIVIGSIMYSFPVAYLMLLDILKFEDSTPYEAAEVLGLSKLDKFKAITLPYLRKPLISVFFATFTMIITDYGVPLMVGGKYITLPVMMYQDVIGMLDFGKGSVIGLILLIPALIACILDILNRDNANQGFVNRPFVNKKNKTRDIIAYIMSVTTFILLFIPIATFSCVAFMKKYPLDMSFSLDNVMQALKLNVGQYLMNSLFIAIIASVFGVIIAVICAYITARIPSRFSKVLHLFSVASLAIPGIVLGLSYALYFKKSFIYGTFIILIMVNMIHFFSSPYLMMYNTFNKLNANLEAVGMTLGIRRLYILKDVLLPMSKGTLLEMFSYFFVNSMMTISAVSFLASISTKPAALMITQFEGQMQLECAAFVSLMILIVNVVMKGSVFMIKRYIERA